MKILGYSLNFPKKVQEYLTYKIYVPKLCEYFFVLFLALIPYTLFFWKLLLPNTVIYSGKDASSFHYQSRVYLSDYLNNEKVSPNVIPFWTEKMFLGFPIYADMERGYLNPINIFLVKYFGPFLSYKLLHFFCYLFGSISLYFFLKKYKINYLGYFASNLVYFFSFFPLYHQQHFNMVLTYYLFPLGLVLLDKFIKTNLFRFSLYNSLLLSFCFYLGSFQFVFLFIILELLYFTIAAAKDITLKGLEFKKTLNFFMYSFSWFLIFILPGLLSTYNLFNISERSSSLEFTQGSYSPSMFINVLFPFIFNLNDKYNGVLFSKDYFIHETYSYIGISTFIFSMISYLFLKDKKLKLFINVLMLLFLFLGFIKYIPVINSINLFPISLFRYWIRAVSLINIGISILIGLFVSNANDYFVKMHLLFRSLYRNFRKVKALFFINFKPLLYVISYLIFLDVISLFEFKPFRFDMGNSSFIKLAKIIHRYDYEFGYWYIIWSAILIASLSILYFSRFKKEKINTYFVIFILSVDILGFGLIATNNSLIKNTSTLFPSTNLNYSVLNTIENKRILDLSESINTGNNLLNNVYGINGYSVLYPRVVSELIKDLGLRSIKHTTLKGDSSEISSRTFMDGNLDRLGALGIEYVLDEGKNPYNINTDQNYIKKLNRTDGFVTIETTSDREELLNTYVLAYPGWEVYVDGLKINNAYSTANRVFIHVYLPSGNHIVDLVFVPKDLYIGMQISVVLSILMIVATYYLFFHSNKKSNIFMNSLKRFKYILWRENVYKF